MFISSILQVTCLSDKNEVKILKIRHRNFVGIGNTLVHFKDFDSVLRPAVGRSHLTETPRADVISVTLQTYHLSTKCRKNTQLSQYVPYMICWNSHVRCCCACSNHWKVWGKPWKQIIRRSWYSNVMYTSKTSGRQPGWKNQGRFPPRLQELKCKSSVLSPTVHSCHCHLLPSDVCQRSSKAERAKLGSPVSVCHWPAVFASDPLKRDGRHLWRSGERSTARL